VEIGPLPHHLYGAACALWYDAGLVRPWNDPGEDLHRAMDGSASTVLGCVEEDRLVSTAMVGHKLTAAAGSAGICAGCSQIGWRAALDRRHSRAQPERTP